MDLLSDVLRFIRLRGAVFFTARMAGRWAVASPRPEELARLVRIREDCIALFHLVTSGECSIALDGDGPVRAPAGSIVVLPRGEAHRIGNDLSLQPMRLQSVYSWSNAETPCISHGSGDVTTRLVCGYLRCDRRFDPLVGALPSLLVDQPGEGKLVAARGRGARTWLRAEVDGEGDGWLARTFRHTMEEAEARRPGSAVMLPRLVELMYVEVLRRYMRLLPPGEPGWLSACRDVHVGQALRLLHEDPARKWTVSALAARVGVSRSSLGDRFHALLGEPPMHYLARWRMHLAEQLLEEPELSIAEVSERVGFDSAVAFHRAFKRHVGIPPGEWRSMNVAP
jgi:AraC-like DNA-binding protein